jgi:hypothetical protein
VARVRRHYAAQRRGVKLMIPAQLR